MDAVSSRHDAPQQDASSSSARHVETEADRALRDLLAYVAKFERLFREALRAHESGRCVLRVEYDRGRVTQMGVEYNDTARPKPKQRKHPRAD